MRRPIRYVAVVSLLLAFGLLSNVAGAQGNEVNRKIDFAIAIHHQQHGDGPLGMVLHGKRDPLRRSDPDLAILVGPFRFGGVH